MESFSAMFDWENRFPVFPPFLFNKHSGKLEIINKFKFYKIIIYLLKKNK